MTVRRFKKHFASPYALSEGHGGVVELHVDWSKRHQKTHIESAQTVPLVLDVLPVCEGSEM